MSKELDELRDRVAALEAKHEEGADITKLYHRQYCGAAGHNFAVVGATASTARNIVSYEFRCANPVCRISYTRLSVDLTPAEQLIVAAYRQTPLPPDNHRKG